MQQRHPVGHLFWRGVVASTSNALMLSGAYPALPHALMAIARRRRGEALPPGLVRSTLHEWRVAVQMTATRWRGFWPLPGADVRGPRPIIMLHGYAMNRANFVPLASRLAAVPLGPIFGFEYWSLGRVSTAARRLAQFVTEVRNQTGAAHVDLVGHSMGGVVGRYYASLGGGDGIVKNLVTIGSPHMGTEISAMGIGHSRKELVRGSSLVTRLEVAKPLAHTKLTVIWSRADGMVPGAKQARVAGVDEIIYDDLGHIAMLMSQRVAKDVIAALQK
ncbi:MAG: alpha/beta fold hydrolase [Kofleriaceae bacterium]|nr:alpha/beta fold hydrolase [Kofleriaceae bacterium]